MPAMPAPAPHIVHFTDHALAKAQLLAIAGSDIEAAVLGGHCQRTRNTGSADWLTTAGRLAVAYNHPHEGDELVALIVTLWRGA